MQSTRTTIRRRSRAALALTAALAVGAGVLAPGTAAADPVDAAQAATLVREAAEQMRFVDEQLHEAELTVEGQQAAAAAAAQQAAAAQEAMKVYEPRLRAIAHSGYTGSNRTRVAAFLTSGSAAQLVQQMTMLDAIADRTNGTIAAAAAAQKAAQEAQAVADQATATARAGLDQLAAQKAEVQRRADAYQADFDRLSAAEQVQVTTAVAGRSLAAPSMSELPVASGSAAAVAIETALNQIGDAYDGGGTGPDVFDCSGLTSYVYAAAGVTLPHSSRAQSSLGRKVDRSELQPGDLVFFYSPISHVGLYIGNGKMVHASTYGRPVAVTSVDQSGYRWGVRLTG